MALELLDELVPAARVLLQELQAGRTRAVGLERRGRTGLEAVGLGGGLAHELVVVDRSGAGPGDRQAAADLRVGYPDLQRQRASHRQAGDVALLDPRVPQEPVQVLDELLLRVHRRVARDLGPRIAAIVPGDAPVA